MLSQLISTNMKSEEPKQINIFFFMQMSGIEGKFYKMLFHVILTHWAQNKSVTVS